MNICTPALFFLFFVNFFFLIMCISFAILCLFLLYNEMNQLHTHIASIGSPSHTLLHPIHLGDYRVAKLSYTVTSSTSYLFYSWQCTQVNLIYQFIPPIPTSTHLIALTAFPFCPANSSATFFKIPYACTVLYNYRFSYYLFLLYMTDFTHLTLINKYTLAFMTIILLNIHTTSLSIHLSMDIQGMAFISCNCKQCDNEH